MLRVVTAVEIIVRNIVVARSGKIGENSQADVFKPAVFYSQTLRSGDELRAGPDRDVGIPERDTLKVVIIGGLGVEQIEIAVTVEDHFAIARTPDYDRFVRGAAGSQVVSALIGRGCINGEIRKRCRVVHNASVELRVVFVEARVNQNDISGLYARTSGRCGIAAS